MKSVYFSFSSLFSYTFLYSEDPFYWYKETREWSYCLAKCVHEKQLKTNFRVGQTLSNEVQKLIKETFQLQAKLSKLLENSTFPNSPLLLTFSTVTKYFHHKQSLRNPPSSKCFNDIRKKKK